MKTRCRMSLLATSIIWFVVAAVGQSQQPSRIWIPLLALNSHHEPVTNLASDSLTVKVDKVQVSDVRLLRGPEMPLELGILIDVSKSEQNRNLRELFAAAKDFAASALKGPDDRVFFMKFDTVPRATGWLTREQIPNLSEDQRAGGGTALYDAVASAVQNHMAQPDWDRPARRILIVISDGEDNSSHVTRAAAIADAVSSGVVIFAFDASRTSDMGDKVMEGIAKRTGGMSFSAYSERNIREDFSKVLHSLEGTYLLNFTAPPGSGVTKNVEVKPVGGEKMEIIYPNGSSRQ